MKRLYFLCNMLATSSLISNWLRHLKLLFCDDSSCFHHLHVAISKKWFRTPLHNRLVRSRADGNSSTIFWVRHLHAMFLSIFFLSQTNFSFNLLSCPSHFQSLSLFRYLLILSSRLSLSSLSLYLCLSSCLSPSYFATETFPGRFGGGGVGGGGVESIHHSLGFWPDLATIKNRLSQNKGSDSQHSIEEYRNCTKWEAIDLRISRLSQENGFSSVAGSRVGRRQAISRSARHPKSRDRVKISRDRVAANCELREMRHQWWRQKPRNFFFQSCRVL